MSRIRPLATAGLTALALGLTPLAASADPSATPSPSPSATAKPIGHAPTTAEYVRQATNRGFVIVVTWNQVRVLTNGVVGITVDRTPGPLTLSQLAGLLSDDSLLRVNGDTAELAASLYIDQDVQLQMGGTVKQLHLIGNQFGTGGCVYGTGANVSFDHVTVTGWDANAKAAAAASVTRPFLVFVQGSTVNANGSTFASLGRDQEGSRGLSTYQGAGLTLDATRFLDNEQGLNAVGDQSDTLRGVSVEHSVGHGAFLASKAAKLSNVTASNNGKDGLTIANASATTLDAVTVISNAGSGVVLAKAPRTVVRSLSATDNGVAALDLRDSDQVTASDVHSSGGRYGIAVDAASNELHASGVKVEKASDAGLQIDGDKFAVSDVTVGSSGAGIRVRPEAANGTVTKSTISQVSGSSFDLAGTHITVSDSSVHGSANGVNVHAPASGIVLRGLTIRDAATGVRVRENVGDVQGSDLTITGGQWGADVRSGGTQLRDSRIDMVADGVRMPAASGLTNVDINANDCAVRGEGGAPLVSGGTIHARRGTCGNAPLPGMWALPPLEPRPLGIFAGVMALLAVVYEVTRRVREGRRGRKLDSAS